MGTPLSWKKTVLSLSNIWLGFQVHPRGPVITMAREKQLGLPEKVAQGEVFSSKAIEKALTMGNLSMPNDTGLPPTIVGMEEGMSRPAAQAEALWQQRYTHFSPFTPVSRWWGASDASAWGVDHKQRNTREGRGPWVPSQG